MASNPGWKGRLDGSFSAALSVALLLTVGACKRETSPSPSSAATSAKALSEVSSSPIEKKATPSFRVLAASTSSIEAISGVDTALVAVGSVLYELTKQGLRQAPELHQGLHPMHYWERWAMLGQFPDAAYWYGVKRSPEERANTNPGVEDPFRLYRRFKTAWGDADWLDVSARESLIGVVPWKDARYLAVVRMNGSDDYRFALVGGKPGVALPIPLAGQKPQAQAELTPAAVGAGPIDAGPAISVAAASAAPVASAAPGAPTLSCPTILQPKAAAGNAEGGLLVVGYRCSKMDELVVERFAAGKRKSVLEVLPPGWPQVTTSADELDSPLRAVIVNDDLAFVAGLSSSYLARFDGKGWRTETPEGTIVDFGQVQGKAWLTTTAGLYLLDEGKWQEQPLSDEARTVSVKKVFGLGDELFVTGKNDHNDVVLLTLRAVKKPIQLPSPAVTKTLREELVVGSPVCQDLFLVVKSNVTDKDNFDSLKAHLTGELAGLKLVIDNWKNGKLLGVALKDFAVAEKLKEAFKDANPKLTCHVPNVIRTIE